MAKNTAAEVANLLSMDFHADRVNWDNIVDAIDHLRALSAQQPEAVAVDAVMIGRFKLACRALMGLRGQRPTVYAEDLETMADVLRVLEAVATLPDVNEAMVDRAYRGWVNAKIPNPSDSRMRMWFALTAALRPAERGTNTEEG